MVIPLKTVNGLVSQFQAGDYIDPVYLPIILASTKMVALRANNLTATTEAMVTLIPSVDFVDRASGTSFSPGVGKIWVLKGMSATTSTADGNPRGCIWRLRCNSTGNVVVSSSQIGLLGCGAQFNKAAVVAGNSVEFSGDEFAIIISGTQSVGITAEGTSGLHSVLLWGFEVSLV